MDLLMMLIFLIMAYIPLSMFLPLLSGGAGYTPTPRKVVDEAFMLMSLRRDEVFFDLGCGTGGILVEALRHCDDVRGVEIEPLRWLVARIRARGAKVILGDLFRQDIVEADIIFLFQYHGSINERIACKIREETRPGTRVISYLHPVEGLQPVGRSGGLFMYET